MILGNTISLIIGILFLVVGSNFLISATESISSKYKISGFFASFFLIGIATSAPEIFISIESALLNETALAIGNTLGSNISNIALVFCLSIFFLNKQSKIKLAVRPFVSLLAITILSFNLLYYDNKVDYIDSVILIFAMFIAIIFFKDEQTSNTRKNDLINTSVVLILFIIGIGLLIYGAEIFIDSATEIAIIFGISTYVIGLTLTAIGTSLPELAASIQSARKGRGDFIVGNVIGSNIFNLSVALSAAAIINTGFVEDFEILRDYSLIIITTLAFYLILKSSNIVIRYIFSILIIAIYMIYIYSVLT